MAEVTSAPAFQAGAVALPRLVVVFGLVGLMEGMRVALPRLVVISPDSGWGV